MFYHVSLHYETSLKKMSILYTHGRVSNLYHIDTKFGIQVGLVKIGIAYLVPRSGTAKKTVIH